MASLENINQDILIEVLSKLPIKNLFQLRCVSKHWHDLLFQASRKLATTTTLPASGLLYHQNSDYSYARLLDDTDDYDGLFDIDLGFMPCGSDLRILDSRNGLLLCLPKTGPQPTLHLCNPMTKTWFTLPKPPKETHPTTLTMAVLAFDPRRPRYFQVIHYTNLSSTLDVAVFNSGTGRWVEKRVLDEPQPQPLMFRHSVFADGALHVLLPPRRHVVRFDVETGERWMIGLPGSESVGLEEILGESEGRVHYANHDGRELTVWVLKERSEWVERLRIDVEGFGDLSCGLLSLDLMNMVRVFPMKMTPVAFHPSSGVVFVGVMDVVFSVDLVSRRMKAVCRVGTHCVFPFSPCLFDGFGDVPSSD
ncbi:F-box protein [Acorus gramineus]|uniref:F-box protein n=1 Tax=Acorus gramineus TaxID=55184 RepID=A0AAV9BDM6_ACOGR|nr:F-box protein [Acorus gramineus]